MPPFVRLRWRRDRTVRIRSPAAKSREVSNRNCVAARWGGEQRNENDQSVTPGCREAVHRELERSVWTERMLRRLTIGESANWVWFTRVDKIYAPANLQSAFAKV
jgi:hypothetical protein